MNEIEKKVVYFPDLILKNWFYSKKYFLTQDNLKNNTWVGREKLMKLLKDIKKYL